ncbi:AsmA family protein [Rhodopila sp.]|uniref:AsmA family protein n=1 Tax=Rhodopila sp. TaxID=2480087 RepID=UPI003D0FA57C
MTGSRTTRRLLWVGIPVVLIVLLVVFWNWDWFIPIVQSRASAALGRPVTIAHLHVRLGRVTEIAADDVVIANPPDWRSGDPPLASVKQLTVQADVWAYIQGHGLVLPLIGLDRPVVYAAETTNGSANFKFSTGSGGGGGASPKIGDLKITDGDAHVVLPQLKADFKARIATRDDAGNGSSIVVSANGTYAAQPIEAHLVGGALLSLRDKEHPWPIDLTVANGPTHVGLKGTVRDPLALKGADLNLRFSGPDMGLLEPLVGFPIPKTPSYEVAGKLDFAGLSDIKFEDFRGRLGQSDVEGSIEEKPDAAETGKKKIPDVTMDLRSNRVDLTDLNGFIGGQPGQLNGKDETPRQRKEVAAARASPELLPNTPISVPRLTWANIHLRYKSAHIEGKDVPFDNLTVVLDVVDGRITVHPISLGVGKGQLTGDVDLTPESTKNVRAKIDLRMQNLDVSRLMAATHTFKGAGTVSGVGTIDSTGNSMASLMANGDGGVKMAMAGGNLSALLVDLTGLQFGNALLSALGIPQKTDVQCFVGDLPLKRGVLDFKAFLLDTGEALTNVGGNVDLRDEKVDLHLKTAAKHFSVLSLPTDIDVGGTFRDPSIRPAAEVAARAGAAVGLGILFAPLAILPTIQFGTSDAQDARCGNLLRQARAEAGGKALPAQQQNAEGGKTPATAR